MFFRQVVAVSCVLLMSTLGCGPEHGRDTAPVSGVVTLDGKPLASVKVTFQPKGGGPSSAGVTDSAGKYTLTGFKGDPGAVVADHRVVIFTMVPDTGVTDDSDVGPIFVEPLLTRYNERSELTFSVKPDVDNTANFDLTTK